MILRSIISIILHIIRLSLNLLFLWVIFNWRVRKARKAFEMELVKIGMERKNAKKLSAHYLKLKEDLVRAMKSSF